ncbi:MAG: glycosyltransferase family 4 protein [Pyrinomonadaceae bacterium]
MTEAVSASRTLKRILMTADGVGGVWTYALELIRALERFSVEVDVAVMGPPLTLAQHEEAQSVPNLNLFKSDYRLEWMDDAWRDVDKAGDWLLHLERRLAPDLVHLNGFAHAVLPWKAPTVVVAHSCVCSWWKAVRGDEPDAGWQEYRRRVERGLSAARVVVAPTASMLHELKQHYSFRSNTRVILNGVDLPIMKGSTKEPFILSAGRIWDEAKNIAALMRVAPELEWPVYLAGEMKSPHALNDRVSATDTCHLLGHLPSRELKRWFDRASIFALPARYEPFGLSALEAALSGCALVLGDIASLREVWGDTALFVSSESRSELKAALSKLISDPELRKQMAQRAQARAKSFTASTMVAEYLRTYKELLPRRTHLVARRTREILSCAS